MIFSWSLFKPRENVTEEAIGWILTWTVAIWMPIMGRKFSSS